ncbi:MAG: tRNA (adenosine(37)-N6)-threonylcarbamoyltransferase complex ATPase subunit type 1 TsaE [Clostridia bacterium]|nr:tRNA (adenosine(37)-N6)-threonylcarbamoyltransferase complex ATPase subunit type 1 TsaE [Clostridia bacterium]
MQTYVSHSPADTRRIAAELAKNIRPGAVIAFRGGLGMGKTAFTRGFVEAMGSDAEVSSPTFAIVNDYGGDPRLYHFDMYRVETWDDLDSTGFYDYMGPDSILLIEWSENIENALPDDAVIVEIARGEGENDRVITVRYGKDDE